MSNSHESPAALFAALSVLVVDDQDRHRAETVAALRRCGLVDLHEAIHGADALRMIGAMATPPALIVLDIDMPVMDGIEMIQQLEHLNYRPAILLASSVDPILLSTVEVLVEELKLPLLGALKKPLDATELPRLLRRLATLSTRVGGGDDNVAASESDLLQALQAGHIETVYQPKITLGSGAVSGFEALARWQGPRGENPSPAYFIPLAERSGLIDALTLAVIGNVLRDSARWRERGWPLQVSVNLSVCALSSPPFCKALFELLQRSAVSAGDIIFEITESALSTDLAAMLAALGRLRLKGFDIAIDDYGTGFSSVQQLSRLPFTELKVDRSFVHDAPNKQHLRTILQSSLDMAHRLGLNTVAEGVETLAELRLLQTLGCQQAQGYIFARPMPARAVPRWLHDNHHIVRELCRVTRPLQLSDESTGLPAARMVPTADLTR